MNIISKIVFVGCQAAREGTDNSIYIVVKRKKKKILSPKAFFLPHLAGSDGMWGCLVLGNGDVEHAIWRHRGSVPPSVEMNGHQHNPLNDHVSWNEKESEM